MKEEEYRKNVYLLQRHQEQMEDLYAQAEVLEKLIEDYNNAMETLNEMVSLEGEKEALMPIGGNVFAFVEIKDMRKVIVNVGGKVYVEKPINGAIDFINRKIEELKKNQRKLLRAAEEIRSKMEEIIEKIKSEDVQVSEKKD